jgi:hypothetical protein
MPLSLPSPPLPSPPWQTNGGTHSLQLKEYAQLHNAHVGNIICVTFKDDRMLLFALLAAIV